jgi:hypothetical protein
MKITISTLIAAVLLAVTMSNAQEPPKMPEPQKEHQWLMQLVGEWNTEIEVTMDPSKPPEKAQGTESVRAIDGFWIMGENKGSHMGKPYTGILTLGFDPAKKKYIGTWVDSMSSYLWTYEGTLDETEKILTLDTEGPCPTAPEKISKFKESLEIKSKDHKVFTSRMQDDQGNWNTMMTINFRRQGSSPASSPSPTGTEGSQTNSMLRKDTGT